MTPFAEGVWLDTEPIRIVGTRLTTTMTVLRLGDGGLLLDSPLTLTKERRAAVEALGEIKHLYAPNTFHHLSIGDWSAAFPTAKVHAPKGLEKKRPDVGIERIHGEAPEPDFIGVVDEIRIEGFRLEETALFYRPSRTLVVADLVHNIGRPEGGWTKFYTKRMGFYDRVALSRALRWTAFSNRSAARSSLDELLTFPFERLVVGHGMPVTVNARDAVAAAFGWMS